MTIALLILLVLIELARLALQYWSAKKYAERDRNTYCTTKDVENIAVLTRKDGMDIVLSNWGNLGYEIASVVDGGQKDGNHYYWLFFTKKKIKSFTED